MSKQFHTRQDVGKPFPLGSSCKGGRVNFALVCPRATSVTLVIEPLQQTSRHSLIQIPLHQAYNKTEDIWHIEIEPSELPFLYGYQIDGKSDPRRGIWFFPDHILIDPYAKQLKSRQWGESAYYGKRPVCVAKQPDDFDWQNDKPPRIPLEETIIYELHVRGFTYHQSSMVNSPGSFKGIMDKIPYLKSLGITAVELLPITEWNECDNRFYNPETGERLLNFWGYNPLTFFGLKSAYSSPGAPVIQDFKELVRSLHRENIEVILDLVYNHSGETDYEGETTSFRGIDNPTYYLLNQEDGDYLNFSGCGNTINCNHPVVRTLIVESLKYWVTEMHVDGFRFDLASILNRDESGQVIENPPLIDMISNDPVLRDVKLIAEAWDASGLYQVGSFSRYTRWHEWNGRYRDDIRRFMAGYHDSVRQLATRIAGSSDLYQENGGSPLNSINFITCHDGFTLYDLVTYEHKQNYKNGEQNRDGENHNHSWNSGCEGHACPEEVTQLRFRRIRTFAALLLLSQGIPMICAGDEFGRSQKGNNNSWCQDNDIGWVDWSLMDKNRDLLRFFQMCIALRKRYSLFRRTSFFEPALSNPLRPDISWQSQQPGNQDWSPECRTLALLLHHTGSMPACDSDFFIMINGNTQDSATFTVPDIPMVDHQQVWHKIIDTAAASPADIVEYENGFPVEPGSGIDLANMGLIVLQKRI